MIVEYPEGATPVVPNAIKGLRFRHITTREELNHLEQANIQSGIAWMQRSRRSDILSEKYIRDLHRRLFGEVWDWAGTFRCTGKNIGIDPQYISLELRTLLDDARYWLEHKTYAPKEAAIRFHHRIVFIHPFPNGNGRHARIMADALLLKLYKTQPIDWAGGHNLQTMNERRRAYIQALRAADIGNYLPLFAYAGIVDE